MNEPNKYGDLLVDTISGSATKKVSMLIYGDAGIGKTSLAKTLGCDDDRVCYINLDEGQLSIRDRDFVCITPKVNPLVTTCQFLIDNEDKFDWVFVDGLNNLAESVYAQEVIKENLKAKPSRYEPWEQMASQMIRWMAKLVTLKPSTIFVTHISIHDDDETGLSYSPEFPGKKAKNKLPALFDEVGCMRTFSELDEEGNRTVKRKIQFLTEAGDNYTCKDRSGALDAIEHCNIDGECDAMGNKCTSIFSKIHGEV